MIETLGDYEQIQSDLLSMDNSCMTIQGKQTIETIEALREVARGVDDLDECPLCDHPVGGHNIGCPMIKLADWLLEQ